MASNAAAALTTRLSVVVTCFDQRFEQAKAGCQASLRRSEHTPRPRRML
jgi:hypothetical protein